MAMAAMLAPAGCSFGGDDEPGPAVGAPRAIAATVDRLERSIAAGEYATVCDELFTASARRRAGGEDCAAQLRSASEGLRRPSIELRGIEVKGERATVSVVTTARGQARVPDDLQLRREDGRWLIEALGG
jgi:hypothetical protein